MQTSLPKYRDNLPQLGQQIFITDGGLETVFVFQKQVELPLFAAFDLLNREDGVEMLKDYYASYVDLALDNGTGLILDTATWRASSGWGMQLGYTPERLTELNQLNVTLLEQIRQEHATDRSPMVINGVIGPQDDGYNPASKMNAAAARAYHQHQIDAFAGSAADMISAVTMTYVDEALGVAQAAERAGIPAAISFTVETDGRLPDGTALEEAICEVDAATSSSPVYYMINCAHPTHFDHVLDAPWTDRIYGVRANASCKSHAELDEAEELDDGNPTEFGQLVAGLRSKLRNLTVVGGCCGTDHRHVGEVCRSFSGA